MLRPLCGEQAKRRICRNSLGVWALKETYYNKANLWPSPPKHPSVKGPKSLSLRKIQDSASPTEDQLPLLRTGFPYWGPASPTETGFLSQKLRCGCYQGAWKDCKPAPWTAQNQERNCSLPPPWWFYPFNTESPRCHWPPTKHPEHCSQYRSNNTRRLDTHWLRFRYPACKRFHHSWLSSAWGKNMVGNLM